MAFYGLTLHYRVKGLWITGHHTHIFILLLKQITVCKPSKYCNFIDHLLFFLLYHWLRLLLNGVQTPYIWHSTGVHEYRDRAHLLPHSADHLQTGNLMIDAFMVWSLQSLADSQGNSILSVLPFKNASFPAVLSVTFFFFACTHTTHKPHSHSQGPITKIPPWTLPTTSDCTTYNLYFTLVLVA